MHSALQAEHLPQDAASSFHDRSGGNPFFLEEICRSLLDEGTLRIEGGRAIATRSLENLILPNTVQAVIRTRLHRLGSRERTVLCMASVIGRTFTRDLLEHALRGTSGMLAWLERSLEALRSAGLIYRTHLLPEATYRFRHVLTLEAGYDSLLLHQRRRAHSLVGLAIEERSSARLEEQAEVLAHHFGEARDWRKRIRYSRLAGERSYRLGQIAQAIALHEQAREALDRLPDDSERRQGLIDLLLRQERLYEAAGGRRPAQQAAIDELLALLGSDTDPDALVEVHVRQADLHILAGCFERAETALDEALAISRRHGSITGEQRALRGIGFLRWHQDRHGEALTVNEELVTLDRERGDAGALLTDLLNLLTVLKRVGDFERGRACADELLRLGQDLQDPAKLLPLYNNLAEFYRALGDGARALSFVDRASGAAAELKFLGPDTYQRTMRAQILLDQGRVEESIRCYMEVIDLHRWEHAAQGAPKSPHASGLEGLADIQRTLGEILVGLGRVEEGLPYLEESASAYGILESAETEALLRSRVAAVCEDQLRFGRAASEWVRVAALCQRSRDLAGESRAREGQGRVARRLEDDEGAESSYREALRLAVSAGDETRQGALHNTLGILAWHRQAYDQALQHYEQALAIYRRRGEPAHVGHGLASIGLTLHRLHRSDEAVRRLEEAIRLERQHDLRQLEAYALGTLGDVRLSMGDDDEAVLCYEQSLRVRLAIGDRRGEGWMLLRLAGVHATRGRGDRSRTNAARAAAIAAEIGDGELANGCASLSGSAATPGAFGA
jgi:tetratricopeptide (TPR) repeat protein